MVLLEKPQTFGPSSPPETPHEACTTKREWEDASKLFRQTICLWFEHITGCPNLKAMAQVNVDMVPLEEKKSDT